MTKQTILGGGIYDEEQDQKQMILIKETTTTKNKSLLTYKHQQTRTHLNTRTSTTIE